MICLLLTSHPLRILYILTIVVFCFTSLPFHIICILWISLSVHIPKSAILFTIIVFIFEQEKDEKEIHWEVRKNSSKLNTKNEWTNAVWYCNSERSYRFLYTQKYIRIYYKRARSCVYLHQSGDLHFVIIFNFTPDYWKWWRLARIEYWKDH